MNIITFGLGGIALITMGYGNAIARSPAGMYSWGTKSITIEDEPVNIKIIESRKASITFTDEDRKMRVQNEPARKISETAK